MSQDTWNANLYDQKHAFVFQYGESLLNILNPQPGERILDIGCGTGHHTHTIAQAGAEAIGLDSSANMIAQARAAYPDETFVHADATDFTFSVPFDAIFSNAALHWVKDAEAAVRCMSAALKPGGRFIIEMGGRGNVATIERVVRQAIHELSGQHSDSPWYFPSVGTYTSLLERHKLMVQTAHLFERPTPLADGERGFQTWLRMFGASILQNQTPETQNQILARAEILARPQLFHNDTWVADYKRLRIVAYKE